MFNSQAGVAKRLIPLFDRILVQRAEALTIIKGGIVIPEEAKAKVLERTVIAVGPGVCITVRIFNDSLLLIIPIE